jgi:anaerobic magnesium-protoporphyrin IX monomethyl ester cyclase
MSQSLKQFVLRSEEAVEVAPPHMKSSKRRIKALLIQPPTIGSVKSLLPQVDSDGGEGIGFKPPLGIMYCASMLQKESIHEILVIDAIASQLSFDELVKQVVDFNPDVVGISAWTDFWYPAYHTGQLIKTALPNVHLSYGGPHLGIYQAETLSIPFVDSVIVGDGEIPFLYLCNMVANGVIDNTMRGLHFKSGGVKPTPDTFYIHGDLDSLPMPDRRMLPIKNYGSVLGKNEYVTTMITSRGCPYRCTFCKLNFQKTLARSASSIVDEFREIHALGIKEVEIYDDTFTWNKKRLIEICQGLIKADLGVKFAIRDRVSSASVDLETLKLLKKAGCIRIHFGIESGVQKIMDKMKKNITVEQARNAVKLAKKAGITVLTYFMFGNLDETEEDMKETINFAVSLNADFAQFSITIPYAGTEMYEEALKSGIISNDYWGEYALNPVPDFMPGGLIENLVSLNTMIEMRNLAIRKFYFRPKFILKEATRLRSINEFMKKSKMAMQLAQSIYTR